ncbi:MAG: hybrid sensor histidine kinase/response regulator [Burkholderiaceae bacterium]
MTDADKIQAAVPAPSENDDQVSSLHCEEAEKLKLRIVDLLAQVDTLRKTTKKQDALEDLVLRLRDANQNLVIATFGAQELQANAESANRRQDEFLTMLGHELRNPLASIVMATGLLEQIAHVHPALPKLHGIIGRQANHITNLVDDLLDATRFSNGTVTLQKQPHLLSAIIDSAVETSQAQLNNRHQQLVVKMAKTPIIIDGDPRRLAQVFSNLLINASKFSPEHETITLTVTRFEKAVSISVKDNGIGIAAEMQPLIFDLFMQGFRSLDRAQGGLGIGLSLVRTIVEAHGGTATVQSQGLGLGSELTVVLPVSQKPLPAPSISPARTTPALHGHILIIEDNPDANETLKDVLMLEGHVVTSALDGMSGISMATKKNYDVIICDIGLPGMDGFDVVKQLRLQASKPLPCFIALTGYSHQENRIHSIEAGFNHYLVKPIGTEALLNIIATCLDHSTKAWQ